ncbi:GNAT family N-acetyltransferase [Nakamurella deserti]|uniref:GNAT family N-acetyltransferase n=1 Tax=Nakamurella deserti TaxID=2164074 RepID=UPI0014789046|nr:GNAT family N-acetyltransferase [Nakamurella deserti]
MRALTPDDAAAVVELVRADEIAVLGEAFLDVADLLGTWARPSFRLDTDTVGVIDRQGRLVAFAELSTPERAEAVVAPAVRGLGIGSVLAGWLERRAVEHGSVIVGQTLASQHHGAVQLLRSRGYAPRWTSWVLRLPPTAQIVQPALPAGWVIRAFLPGRDEQAAYRTVEDAFGEWPHRPPVTYDDWAAMILGRPRFQPWQLLLATDPEGAVRGVAALALSDDGQGWIEQLAVARDHRGRGLGRALLAAGFAATRDHGARDAMLSTDSRTGALDLYLHVGMVVQAEFVQWAKRMTATAGS